MPTKLRKIHNLTKFRRSEFTLNIPLIAGWEIVKDLCPKKVLYKLTVVELDVIAPIYNSHLGTKINIILE